MIRPLLQEQLHTRACYDCLSLRHQAAMQMMIALCCSLHLAQAPKGEALTNEVMVSPI